MAIPDIASRLILDSQMYESAIARAQKSLENFQKSHDPAKRAIDSVKGVLGKFALQAGVAMTAQEAFNKVMHSTEGIADEYRRSIDSVKSVVDAFFTSLSNGDFSSFLKGLDETIRKAREAYDAIDQLQTDMGMNAPYRQEQTVKLEQYRNVIRDKSSTPEARAEAMSSLERESQNLKDAINVEIADAWSSYYASVRKALDEGGFKGEISNSEIMSALQNAISYKDIQSQYQSQQQKVDAGKITVTSDVTGDIVGYKQTEESKAIESSSTFQLLRALVGQEEKLIQAQAYRTQAGSLEQQITSIDKANLRVTNSEVESPKSTKPKQKQEVEKVDYTFYDGYFEALESERKVMKEKLDKYLQSVNKSEIVEEDAEASSSDSAVEALKLRLANYDMLMDKIQELQDLQEVADDVNKSLLEDEIEEWQNLADAINPVAKAIRDADEQMKKFADQQSELEGLGNVMSSLGSIAGSLGEDFLSTAFQAMAGLAQLIKEYQAFASASAVASASKLPFPANIAGMATALATVVSIFSKINFAEGGIVPGSNYSDGITARVSSGEMFINEHDQKNLYDAIHSGNLGGGGRRSLSIHGESMIEVINNVEQRRGRGIIL